MTNLITLSDPQSPAAEAYQSLRTNIEFARLEAPLQSLLVTAADSSTNKSVALANLAVVMARTGSRVVVLDGDLRRPQQHEIFDVADQTGLSTWLQSGEQVALQKTNIEGLRVIPAGPIPPNPVGLLSGKRLNDILTTLSSEADFIMVDAPPVLAVTDAALWASQVDGVILAINAGSTRRDQAQRAKAVLEKAQARIVGAVLLNVDKSTAMSGWSG